MKKIITTMIAIFSITILLASCSKKADNVKLVETLIDSIGTTIDLDSGDAIKQAQNAFDLLTEDDQSKVSNIKKLTKAAEEYESIIKFNEDIEDILNAANPGFSKSESNMTELIARYDEMKKEYKKMSKARKALVSEDFNKLEEAIETLKEYAASAIQPAAAYVKAFNDSNKGKNYTIVKIGCIKQIRNEAEYHFFALTYKNEKGEEKSVYSTARFSGAEAYATIMSRPDLFFADKPVAKDYDALENGNTDLDLDAVIKAANTLEVPAPVTTTEEATTKKSNKKDKDKTKAEKTTAEETTKAN